MNEEKDKELLKSVGSYIESSNKRLALSLTRKNVFLKELSQIVSKAHEIGRKFEEEDAKKKTDYGILIKWTIQ